MKDSYCATARPCTVFAICSSTSAKSLTKEEASVILDEIAGASAALIDTLDRVGRAAAIPGHCHLRGTLGVPCCDSASWRTAWKSESSPR